MPRWEIRSVLHGIFIGLAATIAAMALPLAYPDVPILTWRILFWSGIIVLLIVVVALIFDILLIHLERRKIMPVFLMMIGVLIFVVGAIWFFAENVGKSKEVKPQPVEPTASQPAPKITNVAKEGNKVPEKKLDVGEDSVVIGHVSGKVGNRSVVVGPTDSDGNTILNQSMAIGNNAHAGHGSIAIGNNANARAGGSINAPNNSGIITQGQIGNNTINQAPPARRMTTEQSEKILSAAKNACEKMGHISVTASNADHEAQVYAMDFVKVFRAAGCSADLELPIPTLTPDVTAIHLGVRDIKNIPVEAGEFAKVLGGAGINFDINPLTPEFFPENKFVLIIGSKP